MSEQDRTIIRIQSKRLGLRASSFAIDRCEGGWATAIGTPGCVAFCFQLRSNEPVQSVDMTPNSAAGLIRVLALALEKATS